MAALLHFDCEFTHPSPAVGGLLQIGCAVQKFNMETFEVDTNDVPTFRMNFPLDQKALVTPWVRKNQSDLLKKCLKLGKDKGSKAKKKQELVDFLLRCQLKFGAPLIPAGWCTGSDMAYILHVLEEQAELVHYSGLDLKSLAIPLLGFYDADDKIGETFGVPPIPPEMAHDALADTMYQMKLVNAALKASKKEHS